MNAVVNSGLIEVVPHAGKVIVCPGSVIGDAGNFFQAPGAANPDFGVFLAGFPKLCAVLL